MSQINRVPWGLQSLLGSKNFGRNPQQLAEQVVPVLPMAGHLEFEVLEVTQTSGAITAAGQVVQIQVPANEAWNLHGFGIACTAASTGETYYLTGNVAPANTAQTGTVDLIHVSKQDTTTAAIGSGGSYAFPRPVIISPGSFVRATCREFVGASITVAVSVIYARYDV